MHFYCFGLSVHSQPSSHISVAWSSKLVIEDPDSCQAASRVLPLWRARTPGFRHTVNRMGTKYTGRDSFLGSEKVGHRSSGELNAYAKPQSSGTYPVSDPVFPTATYLSSYAVHVHRYGCNPSRFKT
jgi:hypothetical protein